MIPKVASFGSLQGAAVRSAWQRSSQAAAPNSGSRRKSIDSPSASRSSRSRAGSNCDLVSLDLNWDGSVGVASGLSIPIPTRSPTPPPQTLWSLIESPASFSADDALSHMANLSAAMDASRDSASSKKPMWSSSPASESPTSCLSPVSSAELDDETSVDGQCFASYTAAPEKPAKVHAPISDTPAATLNTAPAPAVKHAKIKIKAKKAGVPGTPSARPGADEKRIYRSTLSMDYIQELLGNLEHVKRMFREVASAPGSSPASAAVGAARMLSRSLERASVRVRETVNDTTTVHMSEDALVTLAEFGWVEVSTEDPEQARVLGAVEAEVHNLASGLVASFHRPTVDKAWWKVGEAYPAVPLYATLPSSSPRASPRSTLDSPKSTLDSPRSAQVPRPFCTPSVKTDVVGPASAAYVAGQGNLTLANLADHLHKAGQSVLSAAGLIQKWVEEEKARIISAEPASTVVGFHPAVSVAF